MSAMAPTNLSRRMQWHRRTGWIGIDLGTSTAKFAQAVRCRDKWLAGPCVSWDLPCGRLDGEDDPIAAALGRLPNRGALAHLFAGEQTALALPQSACPVRRINVPQASAEETVALVVEEHQRDEQQPGDCQVGFWQVASSTAHRTGLLAVAATSIETRQAGAVARRLAQRGYRCHVLNATAPMLAKAVELVEERSPTPCGVLDLGHGTPSLVIVREGWPLFARPLRACGLDKLVEEVAVRLTLTPSDAELLLRHRGFSAASAAGAPRVCRHVLNRCAARYLSRVAAEVKRTLAFIGQTYPECSPNRFWLAGGGASLPEAEAELGGALGLPVRCWQMRSLAGPPPSPMFAGAYALSSLIEEC
jgi:Tfp pilus assembly PilM family ATPase